MRVNNDLHVTCFAASVVFSDLHYLPLRLSAGDGCFVTVRYTGTLDVSQLAQLSQNVWVSSWRRKVLVLQSGDENEKHPR